MKDIAARELKGHNILAVERFWDSTFWMIEFTVLRPTAYGEPGDEMRLFLTEDGYQSALQSQQRREIKIKRYAHVIEGHILDFKPMWALYICIFIVIYGRMIEIYLVTSVAPVPMAAMMGKEWGGMGQNYLRSLLALGFQAFLIIVCVAIYAVLVQNIALEDDIIMAIWSCVGYTVLLCFTLFKTGSLAKSVFQAH